MTAAGDLLAALRGVRAYRITEIPRSDVSPDGGAQPVEGDPDRPQRAAALAAAYHAGCQVAFGWIRTAEGGPVHVLTVGDALTGSAVPSDRAPSGDVLLSLPGGARGTDLGPDGLSGLLGEIGCWRDIAGISDALLVSSGLMSPGLGSSGERRAETNGHPLESRLLRSWTGPFGWMIVATPLPAADVRALADGAARRLHLAEAAADRFPERALEARQVSARHAEFRQGLSSGFWSIRVLAGGADEASATRVTGLLCAAAGLDGLPYRLVPATNGGAAEPGAGVGLGASVGAGPGTRADAHAPEETAPASPFRGSTEVLAALTRPPETEVPGVRLALRPEFDVTPEPVTGPGVTIGDVLDGNLMPAGRFTVSLDSLNRHVFVCGATGAGKSQTVRTLLEAATARGINWLVVEPAKAEYRLMANRLPGTAVVRIRPGEADAVAAGLNPLEPASADGGRFPLQTHADLVRALFIASFRSEEPFPQVLSAALTRVYEEAGWDLALGEPSGAIAAYPTLGDLQRAAERVVAEIGYSQRVTDDVLGFMRVRLASLRAGTTGRFLEGGHPIDFARLLRQNVVLEIEDVGDDRDKAFLMGTVLIRLAEHLRLTRGGSRGSARAGGDGRPRLAHLTVVEEAHRLLRRAEPGERAGAGTHAVEMFAGLLAEIRAYGEGLVIAEQIPARVIPDVVKNTAIKITHRLPAADDRDAVGATMNVTPAQSRYLVTLPPGQAAAFADGMDFPVLVKIMDSAERELVAAPITRSPAAVVTSRSATCGDECAARPCTLREMRHAQRVLGKSTWIRPWAELAVLAHLAGWPAPVPKPARLMPLTTLPGRLGQCAVSHAVDSAVAVRVPALAGEVDTAALALHVATVIRARAERGGSYSPAGPCPAGESQWRLPGPVTEAIVFGVARPSALESAGPLERVLDDFIDCQWPLAYLSASA
jgi:DNA helicase HerA-like ATPase